MRLFLLSALAIGCAKLEPDSFSEERAIAYCEVLQECGELADRGMDAYDCQLSQEQSYDGCVSQDFDAKAAQDCLDAIPELGCDETNAPLETVIEVCDQTCPE